MRAQLSSLDACLYLSGDEDCGVSLGCREHSEGGRPLAYYAGLGTYDDDAVINVTTIEALIVAGVDHVRSTHSQGRPSP